MQILSWNINGLRARLKHNFFSFLDKESPDILCLQETKIQEKDLPLDLKSLNYHQFFHFSLRPGYSGTAIFSKKKPLHISYSNEGEGRLLTLEFKELKILTGYFPNGASSLERHHFKLNFFKDFLQSLGKESKPFILCGDFNIAHQAIDLSFPEKEEKTSGFLPEERKILDDLLSLGFIDTYRTLHPSKQEFTWWSSITRAKLRNEGWRIDYFFLNKEFQHLLKDASILTHDTLGSDHAPTKIVLDLL